MTDLLTYARQLRAAYCRETSELPDRWDVGNPSTGQCHVSALLLHERFGGEILVGIGTYYLNGQVRGDRHYWNVIDGITVDITRDQFPFDVEFRYIEPAEPANWTTLEKSALLARLAGKAAAA